MVDWLTGQKNPTLYHGGVGTNGKTKGNTKSTYHKTIADLILKENGSVCNPDRIGSRIETLQHSYKEAVDIVHQSGEGLEGEEHINFFEKPKATKCKWYNEFINEVFSDRASIFAIYINEMDEEEMISIEDQNASDDNIFHDKSDSDCEENNSVHEHDNVISTITSRLSSIDCDSEDDTTTSLSTSTKKRSKSHQNGSNNDNDLEVLSHLGNSEYIKTSTRKSSSSDISTRKRVKLNKEKNKRKKKTVSAYNAKSKLKNMKSIFATKKEVLTI